MATSKDFEKLWKRYQDVIQSIDKNTFGQKTHKAKKRVLTAIVTK